MNIQQQTDLLAKDILQVSDNLSLREFIAEEDLKRIISDRLTQFAAEQTKSDDTIVLDIYNVQSWDGGDRHNHTFYAKTKEVADEWLAKNKHDLAFKQTLVIYGSLEAKERDNHKAVMRRIWDKLDPVERMALRLEEPPK